jgi:hypothetical protein
LQPYLPEGAGGWRVWEEAPFRGLQVFDFDHEEIFFGRSKAVAEVVKALKERARGGQAFVLVLGKSGSGKSSLARAGIAPFICRYGAVGGVNLWRRAVLRPTEQEEDLLEGLAAALLQEAALPELGSGQARVAELGQVFRESPTAGLMLLKEALARAAPEGEARLLLIVDQLEEFFGPSLTHEAREVLQTPGLDLTPAEQAFVRASMARARRGTLIRWGVVALLAVLTLLAGYQWQRALMAQWKAETARDLALHALNQVIFDIHDKLAKTPGTRKLRQQLLEDAARDLIHLSEQIQSADRRGDRSLGVAYNRIGDTLLLLGQTAPAQEMYRKGLKLAEQLARQAPDNAQARQDLLVSFDTKLRS